MYRLTILENTLNNWNNSQQFITSKEQTAAKLDQPPWTDTTNITVCSSLNGIITGADSHLISAFIMWDLTCGTFHTARNGAGTVFACLSVPGQSQELPRARQRVPEDTADLGLEVRSPSPSQWQLKPRPQGSASSLCLGSRPVIPQAGEGAAVCVQFWVCVASMCLPHSSPQFLSQLSG